MMKFHTDPLRLVGNPDQRAAIAESTGRAVAALPHLIKGHRLYRELDLRGAVREYLAARELNPEDPSLPALLDMHELRRKVAGQPDQFWPKWMLGETMAIQGRDSEAVTSLNSALALPVPRDPSGKIPPQFLAMRREALQTLAAIYERNGQVQRAEEARRQASEIR
jgi:tetratricopeptide (TPR) repeat protein